MGNAYVLSPRASDAATISASDSAGGAGPENMQTPRPSLYWRSGTSNPAILVDFGAARVIDTLVFGWINGTSGDTFRIRAAATEADTTAAPVYDSDALNPSGVPVWPAGSDLSDFELHHRHFELPAVESLQWWRFDFNFGGNPDGYVRIGRLMLGERIEPQFPVIYPVGLTIDEPVAETVDFGGEESPRPRGIKRGVGATFAWARPAEARRFHRLMLAHGSHKDLALVLDKNDAEGAQEVTYIGRVKEPQQAQVIAFRRHSVTFTVKEMGPLPMAAA